MSMILFSYAEVDQKTFYCGTQNNTAILSRQAALWGCEVEMWFWTQSKEKNKSIKLFRDYKTHYASC